MRLTELHGCGTGGCPDYSWQGHSHVITGGWLAFLFPAAMEFQNRASSLLELGHSAAFQRGDPSTASSSPPDELRMSWPSVTVHSLKYSDENMLLIRGDTRVADIYLTEFDHIFRHFYFRNIANELEGDGDEAKSAFLDEAVPREIANSFRTQIALSAG